MGDYIYQFMAKRQRDKSKQGAPSSVPQAPKMTFNLPEVKDQEIFIRDFIKALPDPVRAVQALLILIAGMVAVAQVALRTKNVNRQFLSFLLLTIILRSLLLITVSLDMPLALSLLLLHLNYLIMQVISMLSFPFPSFAWKGLSVGLAHT